MNLPQNPDDDPIAESLVEQAIAEFLIAEDRKSDFRVDEWLDRHATVRSRLEAFLRDHRRTIAAFQSDSSAGESHLDSGLHETTDFNFTGVPSRSGTHREQEARTRVGRYQIVRLLGSGGMGRVYEAIDEQGYRFAIKVIAGHMASTPEAMERFKQEGIVASTVNHPHSVFVHEADTVDGHPYIAMELMPGNTLRDLVQEKGPLPVREAIEKIIDVIDGLQAAHDCKLIHRDVKPSNCYLDATGRVKVGDFGLAKSLDSDLGLTMTGSIVGTPLFASPEQMKGEALDLRTDIYSVCATLFYLLTGKAPFENSNATIVIARALSEEVGSIRELRSDIPESLDRLLKSGMSRNRELRPKDMQQLRSKLVEYLPQQRPVAGLGLRFAAYCLDVLLLSVFVGIAAALRPDWFAYDTDLAVKLRLETHFISSFLQAFYFFGCEWWFRTTLGKSFLGLRVQVEHPKTGRPLSPFIWRVVVWWLFTGILSDTLLVLLGFPS
jgi:eukaryotic-like serine/threonine-protein kinase